MKILLSLLLFLFFNAVNASQHDIAIKKFKFTPAEITSVVGDSIRWTNQDKYNRLPAIVINEKGESLNQQMVETGYALLLTCFPIRDELRKALEVTQEKAQTGETGLWKSHPEFMKKWSN